MLGSAFISNLFEEFDVICRLCLCRSKNLKSIFELDYEKILVDLAKIQVQRDDQLPKKICIQCSDKIKDITSFISQCSTCEETLKEIEREYRWKHGNLQDEIENFLVNEETCETFYINTEAGSSNDVDYPSSTSTELLEGAIAIPGSPDWISTYMFDEIVEKPVKDPRIVCPNCGEIVNSLAVHYKLEPKCKPRVLRCDICQFETSKKLELQLHNKEEHSKTAAVKEKKQRNDVDEHCIDSVYITAPTSVPDKIIKNSVKACQSSGQIVNFLTVQYQPETNHKARNLKCEICQFETSVILEMHLHKQEHSKSDAVEDSLESVDLPGNADSVFPGPDEIMKKSVKKSRKICPSCGEIVKSLTFHFQLDPKCKPKPLKCEMCPFKTSKRLEIKLHKQEHPKPTTYKEQIQERKLKQGKTCPSCGETGLVLRSHWKENPHCRPKKHKCQLCDYKTPRRSRFDEHQRVHMDQGSYEMFICHICSKEFKYETNLRRHLAVHKNPKRFVCEYCGIGRTTNHELTKHIRKHFNNSDFLCDNCGISFHSNLSLILHKKTHHKKTHQIKENAAESKKTFKNIQCNLCQKWVLGETRFKYHMSFTHGVEEKDKYTCHKCPEEFKTLVSWKAHVCTVHWKQHICGYCGKTFNNVTILATHTRSHTRERPFSCTQCTQKFIQKEHLKTHVKAVHNGGAKAECNVCKSIFTSKWNLMIHMRQHTGERPYECHVCTKRFYAANNRKVHVRRAHGEEEVRNITQFVGQGPVPDYSLNI